MPKRQDTQFLFDEELERLDEGYTNLKKLNNNISLKYDANSESEINLKITDDNKAEVKNKDLINRPESVKRRKEDFLTKYMDERSNNHNNGYQSKYKGKNENEIKSLGVTNRGNDSNLKQKFKQFKN